MNCGRRESMTTRRGSIVDAVAHVHASMTTGGDKTSSSSSSPSKTNRATKVVARMTMFFMVSLLLLAEPNDARRGVTKIARISMRPRSTGTTTTTQKTYTIDVTDFFENNDGRVENDNSNNNNNNKSNAISSSGSTWKIDVRQPLIHQIYCQQTNPLFGGSDDADAVVGKSMCSRREETPPNALSHLTQSFKEAFMAAGQKDNSISNNNRIQNQSRRTTKKRHQGPHNHNINDHNNFNNRNNNGPCASQVHVGKMLSAMQQMEEHMRSVGMTQTANDLKSNIEKATRLYKSAPAETRDSLPDLLLWEVETGIHGERKSEHEPLRVRNHSGAMGLFWIAHNVEYQNDLYRQMLDEDKTPLEAAQSAFEHTLEPHMEWATKKVARSMIPRMVPATTDEFFSALSGYPDTENYGPTEHEVVARDVHQILDVWQPIVDDWKQTFDQLQLTDI